MEVAVRAWEQNKSIPSRSFRAMTKKSQILQNGGGRKEKKAVTASLEGERLHTVRYTVRGCAFHVGSLGPFFPWAASKCA